MSSRDTPPPSSASGSRTGRLRGARPLFTLVAVAAVAAAAIGFSRLGSPSSPRDRRTVGQPGEAPSPQLRLSEVVLRGQARALSVHDRAGYVAGWRLRPRRSAAGCTHLYEPAELGVARLETAVPVDARARRGGSSWTATVDVTWGLTGLDPNTSIATLRYTFSKRRGAAVIIADRRAAAAAGRLSGCSGGLQVRRGSRTLVAATTAAAADRVESLLRQRRPAVGRVLPGWHGDLVAYAPGSMRQFDALGRRPAPASIGGIAAVTTTVDGSRDTSAPTAIVVNPPGLRRSRSHQRTRRDDPRGDPRRHPRGGRVDAALGGEGFADYVGIGSVDLPTAVAAGAALRAVRRSGVPAALPAMPRSRSRESPRGDLRGGLARQLADRPDLRAAAGWSSSTAGRGHGRSDLAGAFVTDPRHVAVRLHAQLAGIPEGLAGAG